MSKTWSGGDAWARLTVTTTEVWYVVTPTFDWLVEYKFTWRKSLKITWLVKNAWHFRISYCEGLGISPCIMGLTTRNPYILKEDIELYRILKFRVNWANTEQDTAIQKLQNLLRNVWISGQASGNPYIWIVSKFLSFWMAVSCSILAQLTRNLRIL